jgi:hypothetical protein
VISGGGGIFGIFAVHSINAIKTFRSRFLCQIFNQEIPPATFVDVSGGLQQRLIGANAVMVNHKLFFPLQ